MATILWAAILSSTKLVRLVKAEVVVAVEQDREAVAVVGALEVDAVVVVAAGGAGVAVAGIGTAVIEVAEEIVAGSTRNN
jgi:hypothetical protein